MDLRFVTFDNVFWSWDKIAYNLKSIGINGNYSDDNTVHLHTRQAAKWVFSLGLNRT